MRNDFKKLIREAVKALDHAYISDPKGWRFGSAVLTKQGNIYSSGQYFSDTYSLTLHAEQAALAHAAAHGEHDIDVVMANRNGEYIIKKISELVSFPWPPEKHY